MGIWGQLLLQLILILLNAVFACAEIAVISVSDAKLAKLEEQGDKRAKKIKEIKRRTCKILIYDSGSHYLIRLLRQCVRSG